MLYVSDVVNICHGKLINGSLERECKHFSNDTRVINKDDVFVGIKGETFNGNAFYKEAIKKGASVVILDDENVLDNEYENASVVLVNDSIKAIQELAKYKRSLYDIPVVAITGSVGKSSGIDMVYTVLGWMS